MGEKSESAGVKTRAMARASARDREGRSGECRDIYDGWERVSQRQNRYSRVCSLSTDRDTACTSLVISGSMPSSVIGACLLTRALGFFCWVGRRARRARRRSVWFAASRPKLERTRPSQAGIHGLHLPASRKLQRPVVCRTRFSRASTEGTKSTKASCLRTNSLAVADAPGGPLSCS